MYVVCLGAVLQLLSINYCFCCLCAMLRRFATCTLSSVASISWMIRQRQLALIHLQRLVM